MAATAGKDGGVQIGTNVITLVDSWSLNPSVELIDITAYGSTWRSRTSSLRDWSGSFNMTLDRSDGQQASILDQCEDGTLADIALRFYTSTSTYWSGNARISGVTINSNVADKVSVSVNFSGNGALSYT